MTRLLAALGLAATATFSLAACGQDDRPATWSYVHAAIIAPNCTTSSCHADLTPVAGIKLDSREAAYTMLTGRPCDAPPPSCDEAPEDDATLPSHHYVFPCAPESSELVHLLRAEERGRAMPPDRALPYRDVELVVRWIEEGARCD
jgi:hypothetical protein